MTDDEVKQRLATTQGWPMDKPTPNAARQVEVARHRVGEDAVGLPAVAAPTPRTDAALLPTLFNMQTGEGTMIVRADFARELERERNELERNGNMLRETTKNQNAYIEELEQTVARLRAAIDEHNDGCRQACAAHRCAYKHHDGTLVYGTRNCPECPQDYLIGEEERYPPTAALKKEPG